MPAIKTPWGYAQHTTKIAEGITEYQTASHGGIHLSPARIEALPKHLRAFKPFAGSGWYEEDADWCVVALAFPSEYTATMPDDQAQRVLASAQKTFDQYIAPKLRNKGRSNAESP